MQFFASTQRNGSTLHFTFHKALFASLFIVALLLIPSAVARADSPPNLTQDIPWADTGGTFDIGAGIFDATFNGVEDTMAAFNNGRRQEEIQFGIAAGTLGTLDLPSQADWDMLSDDEKALHIANEERIDRAGMLPGVIGLPLQGLEPNIDAIAQSYAELLVSINGFDHNFDGSPPERIDRDPVIGVDPVNGDCHEFLTYSENLAAFWGTRSRSRPNESTHRFW